MWYGVLADLTLLVHLAFVLFVSVGAVAPRLLVLDDVLIGLDISHRIPVLKLLRKEFHDWQLILMTHDRVWYDLAREYTRHEGMWTYFTMRELAASDSTALLPDSHATAPFATARRALPARPTSIACR